MPRVLCVENKMSLAYRGKMTSAIGEGGEMEGRKYKGKPSLEQELFLLFLGKASRAEKRN